MTNNMNDFTNSDPYENKVEDAVCRDCNKTFQINVQYNRNGVPVSFRAKYCPECNLKPKITGNNGSWGTVNIESAKVPQRNVDGLEESLQTLATSIVNARDEFRAFRKYAEHDIEQNKLKLENFLDVQIGVNDRLNENIANNKLNLDVFKASQAEHNNTVVEYINKIKTLLIALHIMVLGLFIFDLGVVWYIIKH